MSQRPLDPRIADRLRSHADRPGSASARADIEAWVSRAEAGMDGVGTAEDLADLVRALSRLMYSRGLFGFVETETGSDLDIRLQHADVATGLFIEADLVEFYALDDVAKRAVAAARTQVAQSTLRTIETAFWDVFK